MKPGSPSAAIRTSLPSFPRAVLTPSTHHIVNTFSSLMKVGGGAAWNQQRRFMFKLNKRRWLLKIAFQCKAPKITERMEFLWNSGSASSYVKLIDSWVEEESFPQYAVFPVLLTERWEMMSSVCSLYQHYKMSKRKSPLHRSLWQNSLDWSWKLEDLNLHATHNLWTGCHF